MTPRRAALLALFQSERGRLVRRIGRLVGCRVTAEDIAQDTFLRLWSRTAPETADGTAHGDITAGLLLRIGHNLAVDHLRADRVRRTHATGAQTSQPPTPPRPDETLTLRQDLDSLEAVLDRLPERTKRAFLLNRLDGLTYAAIAGRLDVSVSTVEKDIIRALQAVRRWRDQGNTP